MKSIYDIQLKSLQGSDIDWAIAKDKKLLIVNVASQCGLTSQYNGLQALAEKYVDTLVVLGCPCDDFGGQEPGSAQEIEQFCATNFGVSFPMTEKLSIINNTHPLYQWLVDQAKNQDLQSEVKWNFHKFLINGSGKLEGSISSTVDPSHESIVDWIENTN